MSSRTDGDVRDTWPNNSVQQTPLRAGAEPER